MDPGGESTCCTCVCHLLQVRSKGAKVVPRLLFDQWNGQHFVDLFGQKSKQTELSRLLVKTAR